jgi:hypothetical protein
MEKEKLLEEMYAHLDYLRDMRDFYEEFVRYDKPPFIFCKINRLQNSIIKIIKNI